MAVKRDQSSTPAPNSFSNKLQFMNQMFKNRGVPNPGKRPSMNVGMPSTFKFGKGGGGLNFAQKSLTNDIIMEEPDKMKAGYDPSANLQKTLDSVIVVKKGKKKKKRPQTFCVKNSI